MLSIYVPGAHEGQKSILSPMKPEPQMVVSYQMGAGNQTGVPPQEQLVLLTAAPAPTIQIIVEDVFWWQVQSVC